MFSGRITLSSGICEHDDNADNVGHLGDRSDNERGDNGVEIVTGLSSGRRAGDDGVEDIDRDEDGAECDRLNWCDEDNRGEFDGDEWFDIILLIIDFVEIKIYKDWLIVMESVCL